MKQAMCEKLLAVWSFLDVNRLTHRVNRLTELKFWKKLSLNSPKTDRFHTTASRNLADFRDELEIYLVWRGWASDHTNTRPNAWNRYRCTAGYLHEHLTSTSLSVDETTPKWTEAWRFVIWTRRTSRICCRFCILVNICVGFDRKRWRTGTK